jgi:sigma-B regulation protein RsbU (phosphoserine phosphatase)
MSAHSLDETHAELRLAHQRLQQAYREIDQALDAARRIQRRVLPRTLPQVPGLRLAVHHQSSGGAGGDTYDAFPIDESHVGLYLADALGHGVMTTLVLLFLRHAVRALDGNRGLAPDEVLQQVNAALVEEQLPDAPFVSMTYAVIDVSTLTLRFARAGAPAPLFLPRDGPPELAEGGGSLLGVFATSFTARTRALRPGDKVLFLSDGLLPATEEAPASAERLLTSAAEHRELPVDAFVERVARDILGQSSGDDVTLLGLEITPVI